MAHPPTAQTRMQCPLCSGVGLAPRTQLYISKSTCALHGGMEVYVPATVQPNDLRELQQLESAWLKRAGIAYRSSILELGELDKKMFHHSAVVLFNCAAELHKLIEAWNHAADLAPQVLQQDVERPGR